MNTEDLIDHCYIVHYLLIKFDIEKGSVVMENICEYCDETFFEFSTLTEHLNFRRMETRILALNVQIHSQ